MSARAIHRWTQTRCRRQAGARSLLSAIVALGALPIASAPALADPPLVVPIRSCTTSAATVTGFVGNYLGQPGTMRQFLGIPYAVPPTKKNRWQPPQEFCWSGNRNALSIGDVCPQSKFENENEDCLYLNVFTPPTGTVSKLPVMVFIHGGAFLKGAGSLYNPAKLVEQGVVAVTFNYRLGALGFLAHPALDNRSTKNTGMYAIQDQQAALRWVKDNIAKFGGDPKNVTIFGQSAGSFSVVAHLVSPLSKGLFQRAILQSGAPADQSTMADAETAGKAFATRAGCGSQKASCLRALSVNTILNKQDHPFNTALFFKLDKVVLKESIKDSFTAGRFQKVPIISGSAHDEDRFVLNGDASLGSGDACHYTSKITPASYSQLLPSKFFGLASQVAQQYPPGSTDLSANTRFTAAWSDRDFNCHALRLDNRVVQNGGTVYAYEFNDEKSPPILGPITLKDGTNFSYGAYHAVDLQYLFVQGDTISCGLPYQGLSTAQKKLQTSMLIYWTNFAKTGDPNPTTGTIPPHWPAYQPSGGQFISLKASTPKTITAASFDNEHKCSSFWFNYIP